MKVLLLLIAALGLVSAQVSSNLSPVSSDGGAGAQPTVDDASSGLRARSGKQIVKEKVVLAVLAAFKSSAKCNANGVSGVCVSGGQMCSDAGGVVNAVLDPATRSKCPVCCSDGEEAVYKEPASAAVANAGVTAGVTAGATGNNFTAPPSAQMHAIPFAPQTAVYWPLKVDQAARNYSVICSHKSAKELSQYPPSPVAGTTASCTSKDGKQCYACSTRVFMALRSGGKRYHSGIDLYAAKGTPVLAPESGKIVNLYNFFENVCCAIIQTDSGTVINLGEISCNFAKGIEIGKKVEAGQQVGEVGRLKCCHPMLHFETYTNGVTQNLRSRPGAISASVLDPTHYLFNAFEYGK